MSDYWARIESKVRSFTRAGDVLELVQVDRADVPQTCELCGHRGIHWLHRLRNTRTDVTLTVGSECIVNYKRVYKRMFETELRIVASAKLRQVIERLNRKAAGTIVISPVWTGGAGTIDVDPDGEFLGYDEDDENLNAELDSIDADEGAPEGLGSDEIDWDDSGIIQELHERD